MANFKTLISLLGCLFLIGCSDQEENQFFLDLSADGTQQFHYRNIHDMTLTLSKIQKSIDESGFSPVLKGKFSIENTQRGPFEQAWVAFTVNIIIGDQEIASLQRAGILQEHQMDVQFQHNLPKFGLHPEAIKIRVTPIAWMPSYPLFINE